MSQNSTAPPSGTPTCWIHAAISAVGAGDVVFDEIDALEELCLRYGVSQEAMSATLKEQAARAESADDPSQCTPLGLALLDGLLRFEP